MPHDGSARRIQPAARKILAKLSTLLQQFNKYFCLYTIN